MKKISIVLSLIFVVAIILLAILFTQNLNDPKNTLSVLSPEETAVRHAREMTVAGYHIDPNTVEAIQKVEINDMVLVLVQYNAYQIDGETELCEMLLEVEKKLLNQWEAKGGSGLCHKISDPDNTVPISIVSSYGVTSFLESGYSTAFGYLRNEQITEVVVTWDDGLIQHASISERTYLTARKGGSYVDKIETYNDLGEIIFEKQYPTEEEFNP